MPTLNLSERSAPEAQQHPPFSLRTGSVCDVGAGDPGPLGELSGAVAPVGLAPASGDLAPAPAEAGEAPPGEPAPPWPQPWAGEAAALVGVPTSACEVASATLGDSAASGVCSGDSAIGASGAS